MKKSISFSFFVGLFLIISSTTYAYDFKKVDSDINRNAFTKMDTEVDKLKVLTRKMDANRISFSNKKKNDSSNEKNTQSSNEKNTKSSNEKNTK